MTRIVLAQRLAVLTLAHLTIAARSPAQKAAKPNPKVVEFTHEGCEKTGDECRAAYALTLTDGEEFLIRIKSTRPNDFTYDVAGVRLVVPEKNVKESSAYEDKELTQHHDKQYGGYLVYIRRKPNNPSPLANATLIISVTTAKWNIAFGGGFPITTLTDRKFSLQDTTIGEAAKFKVIRNKDHEDKVALSTATFIHLSHSSKPSLAATFGLGVGGNTSYFVGPSYLFGDLGALTVGVAFGGRDDLPVGIAVNGITSDANALANLHKRNAIGVFAAFSFSFLGTDHGPFEKPFKGNEGNTSAAASTENAGAAGDKSKLAVADPVVTPGAQVAVMVTICPEAGKPAPQAAEYQASIGDAAVPFEVIGNGSFTTKAVEGTKCFQGVLKVQAKSGAPAGKFKLKIHVEGEGLTTDVAGDEDVEIKPKP